MSHYWTAADPVETRQAQVEDWIADLVEFGPAIVNEACTRWRRQPGGRRPTPGDIRTFCIEAQRDVQDHRIAIENAVPRWDSWLYDVWGPASTGIPKRDAAMRARDLSLRKADDWRNSDEGRSILGRPMAGAVATATAAALGVTAREVFNPSPERMAADLRKLQGEPETAEDTP